MTETILQNLAETGLMGILLAIAIFGIIFLYKENKAERNARLEDLKEYGNEDKKVQAQTNQTLELILALLRGGKK